MDGYTLSISRCSGGDGVEESFKAKIKRREAALDAFAVAEAYCKESWISLAAALNGTSRIRHLRTGATLLPSIATGAWFAR